MNDNSFKESYCSCLPTTTQHDDNQLIVAKRQMPGLEGICPLPRWISVSSSKDTYMTDYMFSRGSSFDYFKNLMKIKQTLSLISMAAEEEVAIAEHSSEEILTMNYDVEQENDILEESLQSVLLCFSGERSLKNVGSKTMQATTRDRLMNGMFWKELLLENIAIYEAMFPDCEKIVSIHEVSDRIMSFLGKRDLMSMRS